MQKREADPAGEKNGRGGQRELAKEVLDAGLCTGCGACVDICPYQAVYKDRTVALHGCDLSQGRCYTCCPRTPTDFEALRKSLFGETEWTPELGALKGFYVTRAADEAVRRGGQHGGTVTALLSLALEEGLIDAAVVAEEGGGLLPESLAVSDVRAVQRSGGSRFVVSPTVAAFNRALRGDARRIGVVATPCQALALAKMRVQPLSAAPGMERLSLVVGLFCGWALSLEKLTALLAGKTDLAAMTGMDIPPSKYHSLEVYTPGETVRVSLDDVEPCVRESCRTCGDMTAEFSDLSVGSARLPEGWEEARHWNQVIVRTQRGAELLEKARRRGILEFHETPEGNLEKLKAASLGKKRTAESRLSAAARRVPGDRS